MRSSVPVRSDESRPEQADAEALAGVRWAPERAWRWQAHRSWLCGVNYLPSVAVNWIDMWQRSSFAPGVIARELGWAAQLGINSVRLGLPYIVWSDDADRLLARLDHVLGLLDDRSMTAMLYLLDDCEFSGRPPRLGAQPDPVPGLHNSRATGSPGRALVMNERAWPDVERYVAHVVRAFAHDDRVVAWDLYNEPGNRVIFTRDGAQEYDDALEAHALRLLRRVFARARAVGPSQPLTSGGWRVPPPYAGDGVEAHVHPLDIAAFELSDIVSFHAYCSAERMQRIIARLRHYERPLLCTEWMGRQADSRLTEQLPLLHRQDVGSYVWGFVRGRSQTNLPWPDFLDSASRNSDEWFHDLIDAEGAAYDDDEVEAIRRETSRTHG
jgi:hypothetical protein